MMKKLISGKQLFAPVKTHLKISFLGSVFGMFILLPVLVYPVASVIFTVILMLIYFAGIYGVAADCAKQDKKPYTPQEPFWWKGLLLPVGILVCSAVLFALYKIAWTFMSANGALTTGTGVVGSLLFNMWTIMYGAFMGLEKGAVTWYGLGMLAVVPFIASGLGYYAGLRGFEIYDKITGLIYEKKQQ